jgi:hypothetical protein
VFLLHKSCGEKITHKQFRTQLIHELLKNVDMNTTGVQAGRSSLSAPAVPSKSIKIQSLACQRNWKGSEVC